MKTLHNSIQQPPGARSQPYSPPAVMRRGLGGLTLSVLLALSAVGQTAPATWLVDQARHRGLLAREISASDIIRVHVLLEGALRFDPEHVAAREALAELALGRGDEAAAQEHLAAILSADPEHAGAAEAWLPRHLADFQTREERETALTTIAENRSRGAYLRGLACVGLAELSRAAGRPDAVRQWLDQAMEIFPDHPLAALANLRLLKDDASPEQQARAAVQLLRLHPRHVGATWTAANACAAVGLHESARAFYEHAIVVERQRGALNQLGIDRLLDLAANFVALDRLERAAEVLEHAVRTAPTRVEPALLLYWVYAEADRAQAASTLKEALSERFAKVQPDDTWPILEQARAAWFHVWLDEQPQRALALAKAAHSRAEGNAFVQRVFGWALALNGQTQQAIDVLQAIASADPFAAYRLAELHRAAGAREKARAVIAGLSGPPLLGPSRQLIADLCDDLECEMPTLVEPETQAAVERVIDGFDRRTFALAERPTDTLTVQIEPSQASYEVGAWWRTRVTVKNSADSPVTVGRDWLFNPMVLVSLAMEGDRARAFPNLFTINFDRRRLLRPGEQMQLEKTLNVGPVARAAWFTPQQLQRVTITATFDPAQTVGGEWVAGPMGFDLTPVYLNRTPASVSPNALSALRSSLRQADEAAFVAVRRAAALLGEAQRARLGRLNYRPDQAPPGSLRDIVLEALQAESPRVRTHALAALRVAGLDAALVAAVRRNLEHSDWLVRIMAIDLLARQGASFAAQVRTIAEEDADELVRRWAQSYLAEWGQDTTDADSTTREETADPESAAP